LVKNKTGGNEMGEIMLSMKDFDLNGERGSISNAEDKRVYIEKANAKASIAIAANKLLKKTSSTQLEIVDYVSKVRDAIKNPPKDMIEDLLKERVNYAKKNLNKILDLKDKYRGNLPKSKQTSLETWQAELKKQEAELELFYAKQKSEEEADISPDTEASPEQKEKPINKMNKTELLAILDNKGIIPPEGATNARLIELIENKQEE